MYKEIANTNGRYLISEDGKVLDTTPFYMEHMEWQWEIDPTKPREVTITEEEFKYVINGKQRSKNIYTALQETFPELFQISEQNKMRIVNSFLNEEQSTYSINIKDFNRLIYPNELIKIYDTTNNGRRYKNGKPILPTVITPNERGMVVLHKGRRYFAIGTRNIVHFDEQGLPYNAKSWAEPTSTKYYNFQNE